MAQRWKWVAVEKAIKKLDTKNKDGWFTSEQVSAVTSPLVAPESAQIFLRAWANPDIGVLGKGGPFTEIRRVNKNGEVIGTQEKRTNKRGKNQYRWIGDSRDAWKPK
jgi:hypothetical protein